MDFGQGGCQVYFGLVGFEKVKELIKKLLPASVKVIIRKNITNRPIFNVFRTGYKKRVLISYITLPFKRKSLSHSNFFEVTAAARIFNDLEYVVDVMHYEGRIPSLEGYDAIYGFGDVFQRHFERPGAEAKTIYYGAGMHVCHQNNVTLKRVKDVRRKKSVWLCQSGRYVEKAWTHQTVLSDGIIALGNDACAETYRKHYDGPVLSCPAPFFQTLDYKEVMLKRNGGARNSYLWFGSSGLIHKGLDLCLEYFQSRPDLELHVCGHLFQEPDFVRAYYSELFESSNIHVHGFVNVQSEKFQQILEACTFVVFPSCSEGGSASVLTAIGNGALIPVVSRESSVTPEYGVLIEELTASGFAEAIGKTIMMSDEQIRLQQLLSAEYVVAKNGLESYESMLRSNIVILLGLVDSD